MKKRILSFALALTLVLALVPAATPAAVAADGAVGLSSDLTPRYGSNGKFLAPIEPPVAGSIPISNRAQLEAIQNNLNGTYHLTNDIDLSGEEWEPIGEGSDSLFYGTFDGQGYVIRNMTVTGDYVNAGLFYIVSGADIKNVGLEDVYINITFPSNESSVGSYAGGICGHAYDRTTISNCYNTGAVSVSSNKSNKSSYAGGICGNVAGYGAATISNSYNTGAVSSSADNNSYAGGITAFADNLIDMTISNCYNTGTVFSSANTDTSYAGGIIGYAFVSSAHIWSVTISNSYNTGAVSSSGYNSYTGGICGRASGITTVSDCYNTGAVSSYSSYSSRVGGICGSVGMGVTISNSYNTGAVSSSDEVISYVGGICGDAHLDTIDGLASGDMTISNCYNTGAVSSSADRLYSYAGGICGMVVGDRRGTATISNSYNTSAVSSSAESASFVGGICGYASEGASAGVVAISNSYWNSDSGQTINGNPAAVKKGVGGIARSGGVVTDDSAPLTPAEMRQQSSFAGFDFTNIWTISPHVNSNFPILRGLPAPPSPLDSAADWAKPHIISALEKGFIPADIQNDYANTITRAEFCRMAVKWVEYATGKTIDAVLAENGKTRDPDAFTDVTNSDILAAAALGITSGVGNNRFDPGGQFTRQQAATMIMNTCKVIGADTENPPPSGFSDIYLADGWAHTGIDFVRAHGIMSGTGDGFNPKGIYTREQSIVTFNNIVPEELPPISGPLPEGAGPKGLGE